MSANMMPGGARPKIGRHVATELLDQAGVDIHRPAILGRRGYFRDTMGVRGANDRGIYDDAIVVVSPHVFAAFNANTDPSESGGRLALLQPGVYLYRFGVHHPDSPKAYPCLVQAGPVTVKRDNGVVESGEFYLHIHRGGYSTTSSGGCQTIHPDQYDAFLELVKSEMIRYGIGQPLSTLTIPYALTEYTPV